MREELDERTLLTMKVPFWRDVGAAHGSRGRPIADDAACMADRAGADSTDDIEPGDGPEY